MKYYQSGGNVGNLTVGNLTAEESSLSSWAGPYVTEMLGRGAALASQMPYQPYEGPLTAGPSGLQQQAFAGLGALAMPSTLTGAGMGYGGSSGFPTVPTYQPLAEGASFSDLEKQYEQALTNRFGEYRGENSFQQPSFGGGLLFPAEGVKPGGETREIPYYMRDSFDPPSGASLQDLPLGIQQIAERLRPASQPGGLGIIAETTQQPMQQGAPTTQQQIASLMNPYIEQALNPQLEAAKRQAEIQAQQLQSQYGKAGAYGGSRQGVAEAELQRGLLDRMAGLTGTGYQQAYDKAVDLLGKERGYGLDLLGAQRQAGAEQRAIEQAGIAADVAQFEQERDYPYKQLQFMQSLLQGLPLETQSYSYYQPTGLQNLQSGLSDVTGIYSLLSEYLQPSGSDSGTTQAGQQYMTKSEIEALTGVKLP